MIINHNISALNTHNQMSVNTDKASKSMEKLSSGLRINRAADDAAGLSISEKMRGQIRSMDQAQRNAQDGISLVQTAEGALNEVSDMLVRIKELYTENANGTYNANDQANITAEIAALTAEISNIGKNTKFNGISLLDGSLDVSIQINETSTDVMNIKMTTDISSVNPADLDAATTAIDTVSKARSTLGALQNRLEHTVNNLASTSENLTAAESRIRDTDMAKEMMALSKNNILVQASQAMLAQANQQPQGVLQLLR
ncbi:flagellin [Tumebacillus flagellatus]|uniref:Flagellin n=1 Tax=Tumebacillus flagellatus TaxID=1157490 RepID=A0A074LPK9_9BACL|nr:flagellin [Tumebacillus flagellatus]KEO84071.1 flagellin [Tumebacillus flagellatus]